MVDCDRPPWITGHGEEEEKSSGKIKRIRELTERLTEANRAYYARDREIMSNLEYDRLYDELLCLEQETGVALASSPTIRVGYEVAEELPKEAHEAPMLSLDKTKSREGLTQWLKGREGLLSWKLDGLTIVLTYEKGELAKAVTRGNGEVGEVVTGNARMFVNLPLTIPFQGRLSLRGEAVIAYSDFERINREIADEGERYKNPRNLCSGSVRQLNNAVTAARQVRFFPFALVKAEASTEGEKEELEASRRAQLDFLDGQGFEVVEYRRVTAETIGAALDYFERKITECDLPADGLVLTYEDIAYGQSLGRTAKFPRDSIAFKWADEARETRLLGVEWNPSRTGLINPVAIFEPVELEGSTVSRASLHNVSILRGLKLGIGDKILVYKANRIIPQIAENLTCSDSLELPEACPACGGRAEVKKHNEAESLFCANPGCSARKIKAFALFASRDALNIEGLSEATLEKFIARGFLREFTDIFHLESRREEIQAMEGFGEKSCGNLLANIEKARKTTLPRLIYALGIANIGLANAKILCREYRYDLPMMMEAKEEEISSIDGIGPVIAGAFREFFAGEGNRAMVGRLLGELSVGTEAAEETNQALAGLAFAITGSLVHFAGRNALKERIEALGGRVVGSVSSKTTALINNDASSGSSKNKKAKEAGVPVLTEEEWMEKYGVS